MEKETPFSFSWAALWRIFFFGLIVVVLYLARAAVGVLFVSIVISLGLEPFVGFLEKKKVPRILGAIIVFLVFLIILSAVLYLILPIIAVEVGSFFEQFNRIISTLFGFSLSEAAVDLFRGTLDQALEFIRTSNISIGGAVSGALNNFVFVVATVLATFYLIVEKDGTERFLRAILPNAYERTILSLFNGFKVKIRRWVLTQLALSIIVGLLTGLGLWLLGVRYPAVIGALAAIFEIVPVIGPIMVGVIAFLIALSDSVLTGLYVLIFFFLVQQLESHILTPVIVGRTMKIHPVVVIISLLGGAHVAGFIGVLLAVPIAVMIQEIIEYISAAKSRRPQLEV